MNTKTMKESKTVVKTWNLH